MRHQKRVAKLGIDKEHHHSMLQNLAVNLIIHEKIKTTETRAKTLAAYMDKLMNVAKNDDKLHVIRELKRMINHEDCAKKIMKEILPRYADKKSGYTRITKLGFRAGDCASMTLIELT